MLLSIDDRRSPLVFAQEKDYVPSLCFSSISLSLSPAKKGLEENEPTSGS